MKLVPPQFKKASQSASGFSLIELMMAVAIIGIFASMAQMLFGGISDSALFQKSRRNAQEIAGLASTAGAAGADFIVLGDERATIVNLRNGVSPTSGAFSGRVFIIPGLTDSDITGAMQFLTLTDSDLLYNQSGNSGGADQLSGG